MNRLLVVLVAALVLVGCTPVQEERSVGIPYPVQTEENVQNKQQTAEPEQNSTESGTDLPDTQDSAENDELGETEPDSRERAEYDENIIIEEPVEQDSERTREIQAPEALPEVEAPTFNSTFLNYITDLNDCRIQQTNRVGYENKGFPYSTGQAARSTGTVNVVIVAMDFDNAVGSGSVTQKFGDIPSKMEQWSRNWSRGNMQYRVQLHPEWIRAPKGAEWYNCPECHGQGERKQSDAESLAQIVSVIDPHYNLSNVDFIGIIVPPKADKEYYFGMYGPKVALTDEGQQSFGMFGGLSLTEEISLWDTMIHETLHFQGFPGHGPGNGTEYGIMQMQWGRSKAINIWEGFVAGWYGQNEVACINTSDIDDNLFVELGSIESFSDDYEGLVVRINSEEVLVIEHRKVFGSELLAYRVNVNAPTYRDDMGGRLADERNWWSYILEGDGNIAIDKSITYAGVTVTKLGDGQFQVSR